MVRSDRGFLLDIPSINKRSPSRIHLLKILLDYGNNIGKKLLFNIWPFWTFIQIRKVSMNTDIPLPRYKYKTDEYDTIFEDNKSSIVTTIKDMEILKKN